MQYRKYNKTCMTCFMIGLLLVIMIIVYVDPCFHYHPPLQGISYILNDARYQNNGIIRNFEYDAIIIGTSMTQNFKTTEMDNIFDVHSIKVPYSGAYFKEINDSIVIALENNSNIKLVLRSLDLYCIYVDKDTEVIQQGYVYPYFMNDHNPFNDVAYILNKEWMLRGLDNVLYTKEGGISTSFDEYANWNDAFQFGSEAVLQTYQRQEKVDYVVNLTDEDKMMIVENIAQNVTDVARNNPNVDFYLFFTPYSIVWWDSINNTGTFEHNIEMMEIVAEECLKYPNIKLYDFFNNYEMICDLDNYKDFEHYSEEINSKILEWMWEGNYLLTTDNYKAHFDELRDFYYNYDYDGFFDSIAMEERVE